MVNEDFDCIELIRKCIKTFGLQAKQKQVQITGPKFENPLEKFYFKSLYSDERRYGQFILNFLSNSLKFTPAGG